jgi:hypothetical protein
MTLTFDPIEKYMGKGRKDQRLTRTYNLTKNKAKVKMRGGGEIVCEEK